MEIDIAGFGVATLDRITEIAHYPASGGKERILSRENHGGGLTATALVAAAKLGATCWYGGALGDNETSNIVRNLLTGFGVKLPECGLYPREAQPIISDVFVEKNSGERTIFWSDLSAVAPVVNETTLQIARSCRCLFADHHYSTELLPLYQMVKSLGIPIVGDFERVVSSDDQLAFSLIDHPILPAKFALAYTDSTEAAQAVEKILRQPQRTAVAVTDGASGVWFADKENPKVRHQKAFPVTVCDTTGCGDVFHGAYAAALVFGWDVATRVRFAAAASALKATRRGGQGAAPIREEVEQFLKGTSKN